MFFSCWRWPFQTVWFHLRDGPVTLPHRFLLKPFSLYSSSRIFCRHVRILIPYGKKPSYGFQLAIKFASWRGILPISSGRKTFSCTPSMNRHFLGGSSLLSETVEWNVQSCAPRKPESKVSNESDAVIVLSSLCLGDPCLHLRFSLRFNAILKLFSNVQKVTPLNTSKWNRATLNSNRMDNAEISTFEVLQFMLVGDVSHAWLVHVTSLKVSFRDNQGEFVPLGKKAKNALAISRMATTWWQHGDNIAT